jgi:site-specific recombinase XerD
MFAGSLLDPISAALRVVTQRLGHADVAVTVRIYQHVTAQDDRQAADALSRALGGCDHLVVATPRTGP